jgi:hypothetical protein
MIRKKFRFIDTRHFVVDKSLREVEFDTLL